MSRKGTHLGRRSVSTRVRLLCFLDGWGNFHVRRTNLFPNLFFFSWTGDHYHYRNLGDHCLPHVCISSTSVLNCVAPHTSFVSSVQ